jgi:hypothetical protein
MLKHSPEIQHLLAQCCLSTKLTAQVLFPEIFSSPFSSLHDQIFDLVDSGEKYIAIAAPRGIGKTSIARTVAAKGILFRDVSFVLYISQSSTFAEMQTENLKRDMRTTSLVREVFGDIKMSSADTLDDTFSRLAWVAFGSTLVLPRGAGQQVRGANWNNNRPQLIIVDDLEKADEVGNEENRKNLKRWFFSDLLRCVNKYNNDWRFIYIDTIKHEDSLLQNLVSHPDWASLTLEICGDDMKSNAPEYMSDEDIAKEYRAYEEAGMLDSFFMELRNIPIATTDASFRREYFKYYEDDYKLDDNTGLENVVILDPAKTTKPHSAESAIIGIGIDKTAGTIYIRDLHAAKLHPDEMVNQAIAMVQRLKARVLAVEVTSLNEFITYPIKTELARQNVNVEFIELNARGSKIEKRVPALIPFYRRGQIFHNRAVTGPLEQQLLSFPKCRRFDCIDAEAYIVELLEVGMKYFYKDDADEPNDAFEPSEPPLPKFSGWEVI